jgi:peptidoglycan/xylan/chitin deacetylase (PgdA/CDA1 family)
MNIAGPLASLIFGITVLTVFGGLFAYGVYKARERTRKKPAALEKALTYFVEYELPAMQPASAFGGAAASPASVKRRREKEGKPWGLYVLSALAVAGMIAASVSYYRAGRRIVLQGGWAQTGTGATKEFPGPPERAQVNRGPEVVLELKRRSASLFPQARFDQNHDGLIQPEERAALHKEVPLTVLLSVDDNGHAQGLAWLTEAFDRHKLGGKVTFFVTGNYVEGRPSYLGGPVTAWWTMLARESFIGIHGLTHEPGTEWSRERWSEENATVVKDIVARVSLPEGWTWASYPWGARAPYLTFNDDYFQSLDRISPVIKYDASMVVHPTAPLPQPSAALPLRDQSWPFSLDTPLPADVELPFSAKRDRRVSIGSHAIYEVPVYAWAVRKNDALVWIPSVDVNLFDVFPCSGDGVNGELVAAFERNLMAQYEGNRAPFHLGLHAQNYTADKRCERKTIALILEKIDALARSGSKIQYEAAPRLLASLIKEP